jgi:sugar/nucleoside kinase (ribokinase family)
LLDEPVDLLFCNEEEAAIWSESDDVAVAMEHLQQLAKTWVLTLGEKGAIVSDHSRRFSIDAEQVCAVSTLGAGDTFAGAFMFGLVSGYTYEAAGRFASLTSACLVQEPGPRLSGTVLQEIKAKFESNRLEN